MATLLALFGPKRGVRLDVERPLMVGRSSSADIQLLDEKVSREHARFVPDGAGAVRVEDLGSHNGVYVDGKKIDAPLTLKAGNEIAIGDSLFVFDGGIDIAAARFGEATLIVAPPAAGEEGDAGKSFPPVANPAPPTQLAALAKLASRLGLATEAESAARAVLAALDETFKPDRAFVLLWDAGRKQVTPLVGKSDGAAVAISRTVLELAAAGKLAIVLDDAVEDRALKDAKSVVRHRLRSVIVAPILSGTDVVGFLHCDRHAKGAYEPADAALLETFCALTAMHGLFGVLPTMRHESKPALDTPTGKSVVPPAGESRVWVEALRVAGAAARASSTILVTGESGTGKEEIARYVHALSPRAEKPFVAVNCGAISEAIAESELFGHEKGAFTGAVAARTGHVESADGGTLFLDEVGELSPAVQVKLLRVLQERAFYRVGSTVPRRVDVRVIAATHRDLEEDVKAGRFREDLFYRLNVIRIHLPPLRERTEDLGPLARVLLKRIAEGLGKRSPGLSEEAVKALMLHAWPGNARELGNVLERLLVLRAFDAGPIGRDELLDAAMPRRGGAGARAGAGDGKAGSARVAAGATLAEKVAALEREEVEAALKRARGVKTHAAEILGISRPTLDKKIADLGIDLWEGDGPAAPTKAKGGRR